MINGKAGKSPTKLGIFSGGTHKPQGQKKISCLCWWAVKVLPRELRL